MKKTIFSISLILIFMFSSINIFSQEETNKAPKCTSTTNRNHYIKFSPMSLMEIESSVLLGYSYPIKKGAMQLQHELGYVYLNEIYFPFNSYDREYNGLKFRNNFRVYNNYSGAKKSSNNKRSYFGLDLMYKYCKYVEYDKNIYMDAGQYIEIMDIATEKYVGALHFITGIERNLLERGGLMFDFYLGMGVRYKYLKPLYNVDIDDNNNNYSILFPNFNSEYRLFYDDEDTSILLSFMAGIKIGFGL